MSTAIIFTDGASKGNPGEASYGCFVMVTGRLAWGLGCYLGHATNNVAEYSGVVRGLELALEALDAYDVESATLYTDSELVAKQILGEYECRDPKLVPFYDTARAYLAAATKPLVVRHILRESNTLANDLADEAATRRMSVITQASLAVTIDDVPASQNVAPKERPTKRRRR